VIKGNFLQLVFLLQICRCNYFGPGYFSCISGINFRKRAYWSFYFAQRRYEKKEDTLRVRPKSF